ncbi:very long chain fatty acid elongase 4 [Arctopsyche grandis]|uniref:very long chain fatty acid elongase 4 n=1 Tax=Arctopsyche grandis TaxID=121162 RepID=UPI00406D894D
MTNILKYYTWLIDDVGDSRVKDWQTVNSPIPTITISLLYIYMIKIFLPNWMKDKQPYNLKRTIQAYNISLVLANCALVYGYITSGKISAFYVGCNIPDYSDDPLSVRQLNVMWWTLVVKVLELVETSFYILRKKPEQASFLHVYHHWYVIILVWMGVKYVGGGMTTLQTMMNCGIHVLMYFYYFLTSICEGETRRSLLKWKKTLTILQMVQFISLMLHVGINARNGCAIPTTLIYMYMPFIFTIFLLFADFFKNSYSDKSTRDLHKTSKML